MTTLYYREGTSDKVYQADVSDAGNGLFNVDFAYGRRGSTLTTGRKTSAPVPQAEALRILSKLLQEKMAKGYTPGEDGAVYKNTDAEDRFTGILPMLLNPIGESELEHYLIDDNWIAEEKFDGKRMLLRRNLDGSFDAINRKGLIVGCPEVILAEAKKFGRHFTTFILDGGIIGETYHVFDVIEDKILWDRKHDLYLLLQGMPKEHILQVMSVQFHQKRPFLVQLKSRKAEGIVFKHVDAFYKPGRPNSGGSALKVKFKGRHTFVVTGVRDISTRSVQVSAVDHIKDDYVMVGNVTIPINKEIPDIGMLVDVEYLYAYKGGSLFQPIYKGPRDDISKIDDINDLKHKAGEEDDEG